MSEAVTHRELDAVQERADREIESQARQLRQELEFHVQTSAERAAAVEGRLDGVAADVSKIRDSLTELVTEQKVIARWVRPVAISVIGGIILGLAFASFNVLGRAAFGPAQAQPAARSTP